MEIKISKQLKELTPNFNIGVMVAHVELEEENRITMLIQQLEKKIKSELEKMQKNDNERFKRGKNMIKEIKTGEKKKFNRYINSNI